MEIRAALIDKSEIIQKMLSHCLYYFSAKVSRFDSWEDCKAHFAGQAPDIVFVDWEIQKGDSPAIFFISEAIKPAPAVLLCRSSHIKELEAIPPGQAPYRIRKPLDPKEVRDIFSRLVPQVKESKIHSFLRFPKSPGEKKQSAREGRPSPLIKTGWADKARLEKEKRLSPAAKTEKSPSPPKAQSVLDNAKEKTQSFLKQTFSGVLREKADGRAGASSSILAEGPERRAPSDQKPAPKIKLPPLKEAGKEGPIAAQRRPARQKPVLADEQGDSLTSTRKVNKEDIDIDENTQNDLAPMAIKSSPGQSASLTGQNLKLGAGDILSFLNRYKDTSEFQKLAQAALKNSAKEAVDRAFEGAPKEELLSQALAEFKDSQRLKDLVERQITQYVQKQTPALIKEVVEREIKKIIGD